MPTRQQCEEILKHVSRDEYGPLRSAEEARLVTLLTGTDTLRTLHVAGRMVQVSALANGVTEEDLRATQSVWMEIERHLRALPSPAAAALLSASILLQIGKGPGDGDAG